jgi:hypothetical protein
MDNLIQLNELLDDALEFGFMRKFKRDLDIGGRGMKTARQRVNMVPLHEYVNPGIAGPRSKRARKALDMRRRATSRARGAAYGVGIGGVVGVGEGLRQNRNRKKNGR